jgi:hypothetical protein
MATLLSAREAQVRVSPVASTMPSAGQPLHTPLQRLSWPKQPVPPENCSPEERTVTASRRAGQLSRPKSKLVLWGLLL